MTALRLRPYPVKNAMPFVRAVHRRLGVVVRPGMWSVALHNGEGIRGVAIVGRPNARMLDNGERLQVLRVAVIVGTPNGCSMLYGACSRAARAMGASDLFTYIHDDESGVSLKASGWIEDTAFDCDGGEWNRPSRPRKATVEPGHKRRFWAPWSEHAKLLKGQHSMHSSSSEERQHAELWRHWTEQVLKVPDHNFIPCTTYHDLREAMRRARTADAG